MSVLCGVESAGRIGAYPNTAKIWGLKELKNFWPKYLQIGRCAVDPKHQQYFINGAGRWKQTGKKRTCQWCGQVQTMTKKKEVIIHEIWNNA